MTWAQTFSGGRLDLFDPKPEQISLMDIAHSLSQQCRFNGHTKFFYSVAQHSCLMYSHVPVGLKAAALFHDAAEAYIGDIIRPIKNFHLISIERDILRIIFQRFDIDYKLLYQVKYYDDAMLATEQEQALLPGQDLWEIDLPPPLPISINSWQPHQARHTFLRNAAKVGITP